MDKALSILRNTGERGRREGVKIPVFCSEYRKFNADITGRRQEWRGKAGMKKAWGECDEERSRTFYRFAGFIKRNNIKECSNSR